MLRKALPCAALICFALVPAIRPQDASGSNSTATPGKPAPLLPPEGFNDGNGFVLPGADWARATPESEGFSAARLEALRSFVKTHQTDGMMIVSRGHVVFEYGDLSLVSKVASVRKSVLDLLFAVEMQKGLKLDAYRTRPWSSSDSKTKHPSMKLRNTRPCSRS